ncbi:MAG: N-acetylmuramoyl-L-alanine amidase [Acidobacteria bacterium]|nr:N-acetylmuramoyl-L-alanine amidase [Acidobacteriota bacterium]
MTACAMGASAEKKHEQSLWDLAESARAVLMNMPATERKRSDYTLVMDAYRAIYHGNPADTKSPDAIYAVADLLADEGRTLHNEKDLQNAIGQYEFLRKQYPRASLRIPALYQEALIAQNDLHDLKLAQEKYALYIKSYPRSDKADEAQAAIAALKSGRLPTSAESADVPSAKAAAADMPAGTQASAPITDAPVAGPQHEPATPRNGTHAVVSGIRHWSTPTYTRVAIDLGDDVKYEAARVPNPDRIYFDLHGARLAPELVGKSFSVTDDGFLKRIRAAQFTTDITRVVLDVNDVTEYSAFLLPNPYRLIIDIHGDTKSTTTKEAAPAKATSSLQVVEQSKGISTLPPTPTTSMATVRTHILTAPGNIAAERPAPPVATVPSTVATHSTSTHEVATLSAEPTKQKATAQPTSKPISAVVIPPVSKASSRHARAKKEEIMETHVAAPTAAGQRSLVRALGLKINRIVIDAGHGGHDSGTLGAEGIMEKDVVLDVALRLGRLLQERLGAEVIYTRSDDTFIPLETRTAIANKAQADLFISVHANSSRDSSARGVEVYYLNFTSQPDALDVAARENAVSDQSIHQLADLVKKITLKDKIDESREFAENVDDALYKGLASGNGGLRNRGVKKAPFVVLIGANMPSILAEISFVTNPRDAAQLKKPEYRQRVAESLYKGVARYAQGLSGMRVAQRADLSDNGGE